MTAYATRADLIRRFGEAEIASLEDMDNVGVGDPRVSAMALDDATEELNSYVAVRYVLPLLGIPMPLNRACCDVARYRLYKDRPSDEITTRYEQTIKWLQQIASAKAVLTFTPPLTLVQAEQSVVADAYPVGTSYTAGVFSDCVLDTIPRMDPLGCRR